MVSVVIVVQQVVIGIQVVGMLGVLVVLVVSFNYNSFFKLFMVELQNQDLISLMDMIEQMLQFVLFLQVEQQVKMNINLLMFILQSMIGQVGNFIGKMVMDFDGNIGIVKSINVVIDSLISVVMLIVMLDFGLKMMIGFGVIIVVVMIISN